MISRQLDEEAIFHIARDLTDSTKRAAYLDQICAGDAALRARVEVLLKVYDDEQSFLKSAEGPVAPTADFPAATERPGAIIGRYKLMEQIGEGGMGVVFVAEQDRPIRRKVALKVIKPGMDSKSVVGRFEAERQALAMMDHPNIAKVLDAGTTDSGRPYFAMELVKGIPITSYCDMNRLTVRERLELFIEVCQAIQHAHQKGIIHRDVKPSNVLVTLHDGRPVPKVIDFGVAKALNARLTDKTVYTEHFQVIGTLLYMSPEQAEMSGLDIDTRSDIYSLGVLLYELLTGTTPFQQHDLDKAGFDEQRRIIREMEPPRASVRISSLGETATTVADHRMTDPRKLNQLLRGDLDWVVLKALEKDRTRRYETANSLARDVSNYLESEPVDARPPTIGYRAAKYVTRHRVAITVVGLVFASLSFGLVGTGWQWWRATRNANEANEAKNQAEKSALETDHAYRRLVQSSQMLKTTLLDAALPLAYAGEFAKASQLATSLEYVLTGLDETYKRDTMTKIIEGISLFISGDVAEARQMLAEVLGDAPDNVMARSAYLKCVLETGDWPTYSEHMGKLELSPNADFHERLFWAIAKNEVDYELGLDELSKLLEENSSSSLTRAYYALALGQKALDKEKLEIAEEAIQEALRAQNEGLMNSAIATALVLTQLNAYMISGKDARFREKGLQYAPLLEQYSAGHLPLGQFYSSIEEHEKAAEHWQQCAFPDFAAAEFTQHPEFYEMERLRSNWSKTENGRLHDILVDIGLETKEEIMARYDRFIVTASIGSRVAGLQVPLRLRDIGRATAEASAIRASLGDQDLTEGKVPHLMLPLELLQVGADHDSIVAREVNSESSLREMVAKYWDGHVKLGTGEGELAKQAFRECATNVNFYSYIFWADALANLLEEDPKWPVSIDE